MTSTAATGLPAEQPADPGLTKLQPQDKPVVTPDPSQPNWERRKFWLEIAKLTVASIALPVVLSWAARTKLEQDAAQARTQRDEETAAEAVSALVRSRAALLTAVQLCPTQPKECLEQYEEFTQQYMRLSWSAAPTIERLRRSNCISPIEDWRKNACGVLGKRDELDDRFARFTNRFSLWARDLGATPPPKTSTAVCDSARDLFRLGRVVSCGVRLLSLAPKPDELARETRKGESIEDSIVLRNCVELLANEASAAPTKPEGVRKKESDFDWKSWGCSEDAK